MNNSSEKDKDAFSIEAEAKNITTNFELTIKSNPTIIMKSKVEARVMRLVVIGISILATLLSALISFIVYILTAG